MKKLCGITVALLLGAMLLLTGCKADDGAQVFEFLKTQKSFRANPSKYDVIKDYTVSFTVEDDLSYSLQVSYGSAELKNYSVQGTTMEYLGYETKGGSHESWGVTVGYTTYYHVVKLPEATVTMNGQERAFYVLADAQDKHSDSFYTTLVVADSSVTGDDLSSVIGGDIRMILKSN